ncbi:MAG: hypothetical protein SFV17_07220 [Candidatus Obscuribacter sp.]|nr:hypothetical protein [Candidatus Melainabacteria bacterium]MDX1986461.1 hypothetical protein [Candidatus Obscuribacter sp.]
MTRRRKVKNGQVSWFERQMRERTAALAESAHQEHRNAIIEALAMLESDTQQAQNWRQGQLKVAGCKPTEIERQFAQRMQGAAKKFDERVLAAYNVLRGARKWRKGIWKDPLRSLPEKLEALSQG